MGYESKIIVADKHTYSSGDTPWYEDIAIIDMSCMGYNKYDDKKGSHTFKELFDLKLEEDEAVYIDDNNAKNTDCYGDTISYTDDIEGMITWLKNANEVEHYRRIDLLIGLLESIDINKWEHIILMHYGH